METPPIVVDLISKTILRVGQDDKAQEKFEQIIAAQRQAVTTASNGSFAADEVEVAENEPANEPEDEE